MFPYPKRNTICLLAMLCKSREMKTKEKRSSESNSAAMPKYTGEKKKKEKKGTN